MAKATRAKSKYILNCIPSRETERDWSYEVAVDAGLLGAAIPQSKDLREGWWEIGNQERTGSCVGWATADSVLRWHFVKAGRLDQSEQLSVRFIWMAAKETDEFVSRPTTFIEIEGTSLKAALQIALKYGTVLDSTLPFGSDKLFLNDSDLFYAIAAQRRIASYFNLGLDTEKWKSWLANSGPILTRLDVDSTWYAAKENKGNLDIYKRPSKPAGHAVALVGYTADRFIVRNSWGKTWGDEGFAYASYEYASSAFNEAYGVVL